jgi:hypothetical protein
LSTSLASSQGLGQVVARSLLDELDSGLERRPGGDQEDGKVAVESFEPSEKLDSFVAADLAGPEVHVLDHDPDLAGTHRGFRDPWVAGADEGEVVDLEE